jgi:hypothetical protein
MTTTDGLCIAALGLCLLYAPTVFAETPDLGLSSDTPLAPPPSSPEGDAMGSSGRRAEASEPSADISLERRFAYVPDTWQPASLRVVGGYSASYSSSESAARPLAALSRGSGLVNELSAELGLVPRLSLASAALLSPPRDGGTSGGAAGRAGLRFSLTDPRAAGFRLIATGGYLRDFARDSGPFVDVTASVDVGRVRFASSVHGEKMLASNRDDVDLYASSGLSVRATEALSVGAEYVGQDFEDAWESGEAEGGMRHFAGVTLALSPMSGAAIVGGPAFGLDRDSPRLLGRIALSYLF